MNAQFGNNLSSKFAYQLDKSKFLEGDAMGMKTMREIVKDSNKQCKYSHSQNAGKDKPTWRTTEQKAIDDLKSHFKNVANRPCT